MDVTNFYPAKIRSVEPAAEGQVFLMLDVPPEVWSQHKQPAQHVKLSLPGIEPWSGTIANRPGYEFFEFLVKDIGDRSHKIASLQSGDEINISLPAGPGFPVVAHRRHNLILAATGVAICAIRPVIMEILLSRRDWGRIFLFYGERTADKFAFIEERPMWAEYSIEIFLSASQPAEGTYFRGHTGYVQDKLVAEAPDIRNTVAFLAGKDGMIEGFTQELVRLGLNPNMIFLNT